MTDIITYFIGSQVTFPDYSKNVQIIIFWCVTDLYTLSEDELLHQSKKMEHFYLAIIILIISNSVPTKLAIHISAASACTVAR